MGVYFRVVNLDRKEQLNAPHAAKEVEWNHPGRSESSIVLWALWTRWRGDRIDVLSDADYEEGWNWPNVWAEVEADYRRRFGTYLETQKGEACPHGFAWHAVGACEDCFPDVPSMK